MKTKSMLQLLAPIAVTIAWYLFELIIGGIVFSILIFMFGNSSSIGSMWETLAKLPFDFEYNAGGAIFFYIVNLILIIIVEIWITSIPDEEL